MTTPRRDEALARLTGWPLDSELSSLIDDARVTGALHRGGVRTLADFVLEPRDRMLRRFGIGPKTWDRACRALQTQLRPTPDQPAEPRCAGSFLDAVRTALTPTEGELFDALLGNRRIALSPERAALALRHRATGPGAGLEAELAGIRSAMARTVAQDLAAIAREVTAEMEIHEGVVESDHLGAGSRVRELSRETGDPAVPLRLVALWLPERFCMDGDRLCGVSESRLRSIVRCIRRGVAHAKTPVRLAELERLADVPPNRRAVISHVARRTLQMTVSLHPEHGEVVGRPRHSSGRRIELLLEDAAEPVALDDLRFRHRDRFGGIRRTRLLDVLRRTGTFLEVGPRVWSLRARHLDELELLRSEAERIAREIAERDGRHSLTERQQAGEISERSAFLLADLLKRERSVLSLGRGEFCPRRRGLPPLVLAIVAELRLAMGEIAFARFLQNQPPHRRRLVARLLRHNRLFVSTAKDRIDLLENWPFDAQRITLLLRTVRTALEDCGGYASIQRLRPQLNDAGFAEGFIDDDLLLEILRRHGSFELLPSGFIAAPDVGLAQWIRRTARRILRSHALGLSLTQLLVERPELAEFGDCLGELLRQDPMVATADGLNYQVI